MKTLVLIRHAHALHISGGDDYSRPLSERGRADAIRAGKWIHSQGIIPDGIITSPALRTRSTAALILDHSEASPICLQQEGRLYESTLEHYLTVISEVEDTCEILFLVGHNFAISHLLGELTNNPMAEMTPSTVAILDLEGELWEDINAMTATLRNIFIP
jgi:phosphohistidine phosphatase